MIFRVYSAAFFSVFCFCALVRADNLQNTAVSGTTAQLTAGGFGGLDGTGVRIGLNESGVPNVAGTTTAGNLPNGNTNLPAARITNVSSNVTNHASETSGVIVSMLAGENGIATGSSVVAENNSGVTNGGGAGGSYGSTNILDLFQRPLTPILNMSWGSTLAAGTNNGIKYVSPFVDWGATTYGELVVVAGNESGGATGSPSDAYNILNVAASGVRTVVAGNSTLVYNSVDYFNNYNLSNTTSDGRIKTNLVAPGGDPGPSTGTAGATIAGGLTFDDQFHDTAGGLVVNGGSDTYNGVEAGFADNSTASAYRSAAGGGYRPTTIAGTSFAAPLVSGAAALIDQENMVVNHTTAFLDHRVLAALLMNGASKTGLTSINAAGATNPWTRAAATANQTFVITPSDAEGMQTPVQPGLDPLLGTGQLNVLNSLRNFLPGQQHPGVVQSVGWDLNTLLASTVPNTINPGSNPLPGNNSLYRYGYDFSTTAGAFQATLDWDLPATITANPGATDTNGIVAWQPGNATTPSSTITDGTLANLDLYLFNINNGTYSYVNSSTSTIDNVEHIYVPALPAGSYELDVVDAGVAADTTYGLAWAVPEPGSVMMAGLIGLVLLAYRPARAQTKLE